MMANTTSVSSVVILSLDCKTSMYARYVQNIIVVNRERQERWEMYRNINVSKENTLLY